MLTSISSVRTSNSTIRGSSSVTLMIHSVADGQDMPDKVKQIDVAEISVCKLAIKSLILLATNSVVLQWEFVVLTQWMSDPVFGTQNPIQIGVPDEVDSNEVECFPLVPVGDFPDR